MEAQYPKILLPVAGLAATFGRPVVEIRDMLRRGLLPGIERSKGVVQVGADELTAAAIAIGGKVVGLRGKKIAQLFRLVLGALQEAREAGRPAWLVGVKVPGDRWATGIIFGQVEAHQVAWAQDLTAAAARFRQVIDTFIARKVEYPDRLGALSAAAPVVFTDRAGRPVAAPEVPADEIEAER